MNEREGDKTRIVIIGAGIAGLAAAQYLIRHRAPCHVQILEANDRPGGRIYTGTQKYNSCQHCVSHMIVIPYAI